MEDDLDETRLSDSEANWAEWSFVASSRAYHISRIGNVFPVV